MLMASSVSIVFVSCVVVVVVSCMLVLYLYHRQLSMPMMNNSRIIIKYFIVAYIMPIENNSITYQHMLIRYISVYVDMSLKCTFVYCHHSDTRHRRLFDFTDNISIFTYTFFCFWHYRSGGVFRLNIQYSINR